MRTGRYSQSNGKEQLASCEHIEKSGRAVKTASVEIENPIKEQLVALAGGRTHTAQLTYIATC